MDVLKNIVQVLATTALLWAGRHPSQLLPSPTPTQPLVVSIPTVPFYSPSRCLPLPSCPSMPGTSAADGQIFIQTSVFIFGLWIFGIFSLALGAFCLSLRGTQDSPHLHTSPSSEASPTVDRAIDRVGEARTESEADYLKTIQELSVKIQNLEGHNPPPEHQLASVWNDLESQKSQWAAAQRALEVEGQDTVADLRAKIARLEQHVDSHQATVEQVTAGHQRELQTACSKHHTALQTLTARHETKATSLANDLVETQALATRLQTDLDRALKENQLLESSRTSLTEREASQSTTISKPKARLEATSHQLKTAIQEKASIQDRLAAAEEEVESIGTRLYDAVKEHTTVVRQKDDKIAKNTETMSTLRSQLARQRGDWAHFAPQMQRLRHETATKDTEISTLISSLASVTSRIADLEARNMPNTPTPAPAAIEPDVFDDEDARSEVDIESTTSASPASTAGSLTGSHSMTSLRPTSSPGFLRRRHPVNVINERAKQVSEEVATSTREGLGGVVAAEVEQVMVQSTGPESPEPSRNQTNESESVEPSLPEQGLSASMWATSRRAVEHEPPSRPDWAAEAATRKGHTGGKSHKNKNAAQRSRGEWWRPGWGGDRQGFATPTFSTAERIASGKAGRIKAPTNSNKDVHHLSREGEYKFHDYRP